MKTLFCCWKYQFANTLSLTSLAIFSSYPRKAKQSNIQCFHILSQLAWIWVMYYLCLYLSVLYLETLKCRVTVDWVTFRVFIFVAAVLWCFEMIPMTSPYNSEFNMVSKDLIFFFYIYQLNRLINGWGMNNQNTRLSESVWAFTLFKQIVLKHSFRFQTSPGAIL